MRFLWIIRKTGNIKPVSEEDLISKTGACPPFFLLDEGGNMINPVAGINADKPYSPKQTCAKCHDYEKITRVFIFNREKVNLRVKFYEAVYSGPPVQETMVEAGAHLRPYTATFRQKKTPAKNCLTTRRSAVQNMCGKGRDLESGMLEDSINANRAACPSSWSDGERLYGLDIDLNWFY